MVYGEGKQRVNAVAGRAVSNNRPREPRAPGAALFLGQCPTGLSVDSQEGLRLGDFSVPLRELVGSEELHNTFSCTHTDGL